MSQQAHSHGGRIAAYLCLIIGVGLLIFVFVTARDMLTHPVPGLSAGVHPNAGATPDFGKMGAAAIEFVLHLLALLVMCIVGSLIASRGVHMFYVAGAPRESPKSGRPLSETPSDSSTESSTRASGSQ